MSIEQKIEGNVGKLFLSDEIDLDKSPVVRENIKELIDKAKTIEVQMSKVKYIIHQELLHLSRACNYQKIVLKNFI